MESPVFESMRMEVVSGSYVQRWIHLLLISMGGVEEDKKLSFLGKSSQEGSNGSEVSTMDFARKPSVRGVSAIPRTLVATGLPELLPVYLNKTLF